MFAITGVFKGESVENKNISAKDLLEYFNIPIPTEQKVDFAPVGSKNPRRRGISTTLELLRDGETIRIIYYKNKTGKKGEETFEPRNYSVPGTGLRLSLPNNLEEYALMMLSPRNESAVGYVKNRRAEKWYRYVDTEKEVETGYKETLAIAKIIELILKESDSKILAVAKGIEFKTKEGKFNIPIGKIECSDNPETRAMAARMELQKLGMKYPDQVSNALLDDSTYIRGAVQEAIDRNFLVNMPAPGNTRMWSWKDGSEIIRSAPNQDAKVALVSFVMQPAGYESFFKKYDLLKGIANVASEAIGAMSQAGTSNLEVLKDADDKGFIKYDKDTGAVFIQKKGSSDFRTLMKIEPGIEAWIIELNNKISPQTLGQITSLLNG